MSLILGIDTSLTCCSTALLDTESGKAYSKAIDMSRGYAEILLPMMQDLHEEAGTNYKDVSGICVTRGPGGFTGLRVGLSTARALGVSLDIPVIGVSSFDAYSATVMAADVVPDDAAYLCVFESRRDELYIAGYDSTGQEAIPAQSVLTDIFTEKYRSHWEDKTLYVAGDGASRLIAEAGCPSKSFEYITEPRNIDPVALLKHNMDKLSGLKGYDDSVDREPLYLRDADVSKPKMPEKTLGCC